MGPLRTCLKPALTRLHKLLWAFSDSWVRPGEPQNVCSHDAQTRV